MRRRSLLSYAGWAAGAYVVRKGFTWIEGTTGGARARMAMVGDEPGDVHLTHSYGDGAVPVGFPSALPLMPRMQLVATRVRTREKFSYWQLDYWTEARHEEALRYHREAFEGAGWKVSGTERWGKDGVNQGGWLMTAVKDGLAAEVYVFDRGASEEQPIQLVVEERRGR